MRPVLIIVAVLLCRCSPSPAAPRLVATEEPPSDRCPRGGHRIDLGDGAPLHLCHGEDGQPATVEVHVEPAGPNCAHGGARLETQAAGGPKITAFVCSAESPVVVSEPPGLDCPAGGVRITTSGTSRFVCNGQSAVVATEPPGTHCPYGGVRLAVPSEPVNYVCSGAQGGLLGVDAGADLDVSETAPVVTLSGTATAGSLRWQQLSGPLVVLSSGTFSPPDVQRDTLLVFRLTATHNGVIEADDVEVRVRHQNAPPTVSAGADFAAAAGSTVVLRATAFEPDGQQLTYSWRQLAGAPLPLVGADSAVATFVAPVAAAAVVVPFEVTVSDGALSSTSGVNVTVNAQNSGPAFSTPVRDETVVAGEPFVRAYTLVDPNQEPVGLSLTPGSAPLPPGIVVSANRLQGTCRRAGRYGPVRLRASDPAGLFVDSPPFFFTVLAGAATALAFEAPPRSEELVGRPAAPLTVRLEDAFGNLTAADGVPVTLQVTGACQQPHVAALSSAGLATFPRVTCATPGAAVIDATAPGLTAKATSGRQVQVRLPELPVRPLELLQSLNDARRPVVADMNGDGTPDWLAPSPSTNTVAIAGGAPGQPARVVPVGGGPVDLAVADVNRDGRMDFVAVRFADDAVQALVSDSSAASGYRGLPPVTVPDAPVTIASGDLDADGVTDFAVASFAGSSLTVLFGDAAAPTGFRPPVTFGLSGAYMAAIADLNGDGVNDIAAVGTTSNQLMMYLGVPSALGTFQASFVGISSGAYAVAVGDVDADGVPDVAVAHVSGGITIVPKAAIALPLPRVLSAPAALRGLVIADVDLDGRADLIAAGPGQNALHVWLQNPTIPGTFAPRQAVPVTGTPWSVAVADVNFDGAPDLLTGLHLGPAQGLYVARQHKRQRGTFTALPASSSSIVRALRTADVDRDGRPDVLVLSDDGLRVHLQGAAPGSLQPALAVPGTQLTAPSALEVADLDLDGRLDVVAGYGSQALVLLNATGAMGAPTFTTAASLPVSQAASIAIHDLDGDLVPELTFGLNTGVDVYRAVPAPALTYVREGGLSTPSPASVLAVDSDSDGTVEVVAVWGQGSGVVRNLALSFLPFSANPVTPVLNDLDGDGRVDLFNQTTHGLLNVSFRSTNLALVSSTALTTSPAPAFAVAAADLDGDGLRDLVACTSNGVELRTHVAPRAFASPAVVDSRLAMRVVPTDFDLDGRTDLVTGSVSAVWVLRGQ